MKVGARTPIAVLVLIVGCDTTGPSSPGTGDGSSAGGTASTGGTGGSLSGGAPSSGGRSAGGSGGAAGENGATGGDSGGPTPSYHPPPGFEDCIHAVVKEECSEGWCKLPASCFVMGSAEDEWHRGRNTENRTAVTLTNSIEIQRKEMTRKEWEEITETPAPGSELCAEPDCPVAMVSWWDAITAADLLSEQKGLAPCYEPTDCSGSLGIDLVCTGVADPEKSVYACEGYRLPTRAEAEYAARAGTTSTFYSGDITPYSPDGECAEDPALELIAWYCHNSGDRPHVGGELAPNGFGLYDMIGNLGEWSNEEQYGSSTPGGEDPRGMVGVVYARLRLAPQYDNMSWLVRTSSLLSGPADTHAANTGFRLVRTLPE